MRRIGAVCAIACYIIAFSSNRPNYDYFESGTTTPFKAVAKSYSDFELKRVRNLQKIELKTCTLSKEGINNIVLEVKQKELQEEKERELKQKQYEDDLFCLAVAIYREHGSNVCTDEQRLADGAVIMNRVNSPKFPNTIRGVLMANNAYQGFENGIYFPRVASCSCEIKAVERAYAIAKRVLDGERICPSNVYYQAEFGQGTGLWKKIGNTYYCYG